MTQIERDELIYAAGFFDGEGCVYIRRSPPHRQHVTIGYGVTVQVTNTNHEIVLFYKKAFGGSIQAAPPRPRRRPLWVWRASAQIAARCLRSLLPYLRVKRAEAEIALSLQDAIDRHQAQTQPHPGRRGLPRVPDAELAVREGHYRRLYALPARRRNVGG